MLCFAALAKCVGPFVFSLARSPSGLARSVFCFVSGCVVLLFRRLGSLLLWLGLAWLGFCPLVWVLVFSFCCSGGFASCVFSVPDPSGDLNDVLLSTLFGLVCPFT